MLKNINDKTRDTIHMIVFFLIKKKILKLTHGIIMKCHMTV